MLPGDEPLCDIFPLLDVSHYIATTPERQPILEMSPWMSLFGMRDNVLRSLPTNKTSSDPISPLLHNIGREGQWRVLAVYVLSHQIVAPQEAQ